MEYVVVHFIERRQVLVNDVPLGSTEDTLEVDEGHHSFTLDGDQDFTPASIETAVTDTSVLDPLVLTFTPVPNPLSDRSGIAAPSFPSRHERPNV
jgi:hypothetical protein